MIKNIAITILLIASIHTQLKNNAQKEYIATIQAEVEDNYGPDLECMLSFTAEEKQTMDVSEMIGLCD